MATSAQIDAGNHKPAMRMMSMVLHPRSGSVVGQRMLLFDHGLGAGDLCIGAGNNPRHDARRMVQLLITGLCIR